MSKFEEALDKGDIISGKYVGSEIEDVVYKALCIATIVEENLSEFKYTSSLHGILKDILEEIER